MKTYRIISALLGLALCGSGVALAQTGFMDTFDGAPATPQPYTAPVPGLAAWDVVVHSRDVNTWASLEPMDAHHGPDCSAPPATHPTTGSYGDAVFQCNNHIMTALRASGYGAIYLTPPVVADWSTGPSVIQFDMSTARSSDRDWVDVWVSPMEDNLTLPLDDWLPDLQGPPRRSIHLRMDNTQGGSMFRTAITTDFTGSEVSTNNYWPYENTLTPSAARRDTFQLTISSTYLKFGMPAYNLWWMDGPVADLGWTQGVVQFGHHSYNPYKDCGDPPAAGCGPNTWHWDNVSVNPSLPFTITKAPQEYVSNLTPSNLVTFPSPAQSGDHLRFAGLGQQYQVSLDGGVTWQMVPIQPQERYQPDHAQNYWMPMPAGTQAVNIRAQGGYWGADWLARDFALWGQVQVPPNQRTPTPVRTATPTPTTTPLPTTAPTQTPPPSSTPAPTPTDVPTPLPVPTATATAVTDPTATPLPAPRCARVDDINGGLAWTPLPDSACMQ